MKKLLLAALFLCSMVTMNAQDITATIETTYYDASKGYDLYLQDVMELPNNEKIAVYTKYTGFPVFIHKYDATGKFIKEVKHEGIGLIDNIFFYNRNLYIFYLRSESKGEFIVLKADIDKFVFTEKKLMDVSVDKHVPRKGILADTSANFFFGEGVRTNSTVFYTLPNSDKSSFIVYQASTAGQNEKVNQKLTYFDTEKLNVLFEYDYNKPEVAKNLHYYRDMFTDKENNVYLLANTKPTNVFGFSGYEFQKISNNGLQNIKLSNEQTNPETLGMVKKKNSFAIVGFYSSPKKNIYYLGFCFFDVDPVAVKMLNSKFHPFSSQFYIERFGKDKRKPLAALDYRRQVHATENDNIIYSGETIEFGNYLDIVVAKISNNGDLLWDKNIQKNQQSFNNGALSYVSKIKGEDLYMFFNSDRDVKGGKDIPIFKNTNQKSADFMVVKLDGKNGAISYKTLLTEKEKKVTPHPRFCVKSATDGEFYIFGQDHVHRMLAKVKL